MESRTEGFVVQREIEIAASPETIWELLVDPARAQAWWGQSVTLEPTPGGTLRSRSPRGASPGARSTS